MKTVILGAGAMGSGIGGALAGAGIDVDLVDVAKQTVEAIEQCGLTIEEKTGQKATIRLKATDDPGQIGLAGLSSPLQFSPPSTVKLTKASLDAILSALAGVFFSHYENQK